MTRRVILAGLTAAALIFTLPVTLHAQAPQDYSDARFTAAQKQGGIIIVESHADWCLPCKIQEPILEKLRAQPAFRTMQILRIGETTPAAAWQRHRLSGYGTIIVYRGGKEVARGSPTTEALMRAMLEKTAG